jgi:GNAT superfamily N-acetyltransferase
MQKVVIYESSAKSLGQNGAYCPFADSGPTVQVDYHCYSVGPPPISRNLHDPSQCIVAADTPCQHRFMQIRDALPEDALAASRVLNRSITELCEADHQNEPAILAQWLRNKTPENFLAWVGQPDSSLLVAVENSDILAIGSITDTGEITLNYVSPDARFRGVSRALLHALEARAVERVNKRCTLTSTKTARRFYLSNGYVEEGMPVRVFGTASGYPMSKILVADSDG